MITSPSEKSQEAMQAKTQAIPPRVREEVSPLPSGGTEGQVLTMGETEAEWEDLPKELPEGGTAGQVLTLEVPEGETDPVPAWATPAGGKAALSAAIDKSFPNGNSVTFTNTPFSASMSSANSTKLTLQIQTECGDNLLDPNEAGKSYYFMIMCLPLKVSASGAAASPTVTHPPIGYTSGDPIRYKARIKSIKFNIMVKTDASPSTYVNKGNLTMMTERGTGNYIEFDVDPGSYTYANKYVSGVFEYSYSATEIGGTVTSYKISTAEIELDDIHIISGYKNGTEQTEVSFATQPTVSTAYTNFSLWKLS